MSRPVSVIRWGTAACLGLDGLPSHEVRLVAERWCGIADPEGSETGARVLRLVVPREARESSATEPGRIRIGIRGGDGLAPLELRIGPHGVFPGNGAEPDRVRYSSRRPPSAVEHELLVDLGVNHLLARQGLPVIHGCAFKLGDASVLGLGESFSGKTTVSVAAMRAGGRVVSDDVVLVAPDEAERYSLLPVRSYGWLRGRTREIIPSELRKKMVENDENGQPRWVLNREDGGAGFVEETTPNVIWIQSVDRRLKESRIESVDQGQVFAALIRASSPLYLSRHCPEIRDKLIPVFRSLCEQCRGFRVRLGRRLLDDPVGEMERLVDLSR